MNPRGPWTLKPGHTSPPLARCLALTQESTDSTGLPASHDILVKGDSFGTLLQVATGICRISQPPQKIFGPIGPLKTYLKNIDSRGICMEKKAQYLTWNFQTDRFAHDPNTKTPSLRRVETKLLGSSKLEVISYPSNEGGF